MSAKGPLPDRPNTLGQAWRRMAEPDLRPRHPPRDLPTLPDWPPLPDEAAPSAWSSRASDTPGEPVVPAESASHAAVASSRPGRGGMLRRFRRASKRARLGFMAAGIVLVVALIIACSSIALRATGHRVSSDVVPGVAGHSSTPRALATGTPHATSQPTPTAAPLPPLSLAFTCASGQLRGTGQVCVQTLPHATLSLSVRYCDGSTAKGLHSSVAADGSGTYTWRWQVRTTCAGTATATVTTQANGQSLTASDTFTITR